jgi:hypothetical protein
MIVSQKTPAPAFGLSPPTIDRRPAAAIQHVALARLAARLRAGSLDRALAHGADPRATPQLAARARLLTSPGRRARAADALEHLVRAARGPQRRWWALTRHNSVLANSSELHALASLLRSERPVYARGVAVLNELLSDGTGPVYRDADGQLASRLRQVRDAIEGGDEFHARASSKS